MDAEKEIPSCELIATKCIGSGVTSEVYQGHWTRIGKARAKKTWSKWWRKKVWKGLRDC